MVIFGMLLLGVLAVGAVLALGLRTLTLGEARTEAELMRPAAPAVCYDVPDGQDPAVLVAALAHAGFTARARMERGTERLWVHCEDEERERVREVIEHVRRSAVDGALLPAHAVAFVDER